MTFEKKCLAELSDIIAVHFECSGCHVSTVVPITAGVSDYAKSLVSSACRHCHQAWELTPNSAEHKTLCDFAYAIEGIAAQMRGRNLKLRLEIACPE